MANKRAKRNRTPDQRRLIHRPRLLSRLETSPASTILLIAPPGYGKTTLLRQWLGRSDAVLYTAGFADRDVAALARGLAYAFVRLAPGAPRYVEEMLTVFEHPGRAPDEIARALLYQAADLPPRTRLVIDDYEKIAGFAPAERVIELFHESEKFDLVIASRLRPTWATARRFLYAELLELDAYELAFGQDEVEQVVGELRAVDEVVSQARGWPAVISLIASAGRMTVHAPITVSSVLYSFVAEEIFNSAAKGVKSTLLDVALRPPSTNPRLKTDGSLLSASAVERAVATGLAETDDSGLDLHPLARAFLLERIRADSDDVRVRQALISAIRNKDWDHAFSLIRAFGLRGEIDSLITAAFRDLLESGRIATLESFGHSATIDFNLTLPVIELVEAEVAFRDGRHDAARSLALSAADRLATGHPLRSHALTVAGTSAFLRFDLNEADGLFRRAANEATDRHDRVAALWGRCQSSLFLERPDMTEITKEIGDAAATPEERLRAAMAELQTARCRGLNNVDRHAATGALLPHVRNPRVRTSFGNICGYIRVLQGRYDEALDVVSAALIDADRFELAFARPHLKWTHAAAALGLRKFTVADTSLREVENIPDNLRDIHTELNTRSLRARILLTQHRPREANVVVAPEWDNPSARMTYGEYLATRALSLAVLHQPDAARAEASRAVATTNAVEVRIAALAVAAILAVGTSESENAAGVFFRASVTSEVWDPLVIAVRAFPDVLRVLASDKQRHQTLARVLERSRDPALARRCGIPVGLRHGRLDLLSKRELEVIDLLWQGMTNREIAQTLFIAESTAKIHVHHILDKLQARSRTEAVARYAEMAGRTTGDDATKKS